MTKHIILSMILLFAAEISAFDFVRDGNPACVIAASSSPSRFEKLAQEDLREFLGKVTGVAFEIVQEQEVNGRPAIYVGQTEFAQKNGYIPDDFQNEEWLVLQVGENLIVTGGRPIGTFYAVWRLLNRLGCYPLTMESTRIPALPVHQANGLTCRGKPHFNGRVIYDRFPVLSTIMGMPQEGRTAYQMWLLRCGANGRQHRLFLPLYEGGFTYITTQPSWHTLCLYVEPAKYFDKHPEYFSMNEKGERVRPRTDEAGGSLCLSNQDVQRIASARLLEIIKEDRERLPREEWPICYDVSLLDLFPYICKCPECSAIIQEEGGKDFGLLLRFVNGLAEKVEKSFPGIQIRTCSYGAASSCEGVHVRPRHNVAIQVADLFVTCDYFRPLAHPLNAPARKKFEQFRDLGGQLIVWDYWNMGSFFEPPRLETILDTIQPDIQYFSSLGVKAVFIEASRHTYKPQNFIDLQYFIGSRLLMDPQEDVEHLIDIFLEGHYGKAAPLLRQYLERLRAAVAADVSLKPGMNIPPWAYQTADFVVSSYMLLQNAAAMVPDGTPERRRVHDELLPILWIAIQRPWLYEKAFSAAEIPMNRLKEECRDYSHAHMARFGGKDLDVRSRWVKTRLDCDAELQAFGSGSVQPPKEFRAISEEKIRVMPPGLFVQKPAHYSAIVKDEEAITGEAICSNYPNESYHGEGKFRSDPNGRWKFYATEFGFGGSPKVILQNIPKDEKYHWYKLPGIELTDNCNFYGHLWHFHMPLGSAFRPDDGVSDGNRWDLWFHAKFTGPAYVPSSKKENATWCDLVVLVKPDASPLVDMGDK